MSRINTNKISYILIYFSTTAILIYVNTYLPVFFFTVLNVDRIKLAFIQFISYSGLIIKPMFGYITDKYSINNYKRKPYIIISALVILLSYIGIVYNLTEISIFGIFLFINFTASSMIDVATKGLIVDTSPTKAEKNKNTFFTKLGAALGSIFPNVVFIIYLHNIYSVNSWTVFLSFSFLFLIPLTIFSLFSGEKGPSDLLSAKEQEKPKEGEFSNFKFSFLMICIFIFLLYGDKLFEFPLEPWIVDKFGENQFYIFSFLMIIGIFVNILGFIMGAYVFKSVNRKILLAISTAIIGIFEILFAFVNFMTLLILFAIIQILAGIISINLSSLILEFAKQKKVFYVQIIISFFSLSVLIFVPLGTLLSNFIMTELIFIIAGIILLTSLIPLSKIEIR